MLQFTKRILTELEGVYCLEIFEIDGHQRIVAASEIHNGSCKIVDILTAQEEFAWSGYGGCMNICPVNFSGDIVAIWDFYKGFQSKEAKLIQAHRDANGQWAHEVLITLPYLHRCGVVAGLDETWVVASTLCADRAHADDWSQPGCIQVAKLPKLGEPIEFSVIQNGITKNHGFWQGTLDGKQVTLVSGSEGVFCIQPPVKVGVDWQVERLFSREISDMAVCDIDGDGVDEILMFEGFHGNLATVNKRIDGVWSIVYTIPMDFAHGIWGGTLIGENVFVVGSRKGEGDLLLIRYINGSYETVLIDRGAAPSNIRGISFNGLSYILCAERDRDYVSLYEISEVK